MSGRFNNVKTTSRNTGGLTITFSPESKFPDNNRVVINSTWGIPDTSLSSYKRDWNVQFKESGQVTVSETKDDYRVSVALDTASYNVLQFNDLDENGEPSTTWTLRISLKEKYHFVVQSFWGRSANTRPARLDQDCYLLSVMQRHRTLMQKCRHMKIVWPEYQKLHQQNSRWFDRDVLHDTIRRQRAKDARADPAIYVTECMEALQSEDMEAARLTGLLARSNVSAKVFKHPTLTDRYYVELRSNKPDDVWKLSGQEQLFFAPIPPPENATERQKQDNINAAGIFGTEPTKIPRSIQRAWRGTAFTLDGRSCAIIDNVRTNMNTSMIEQHVSHDTVLRISAITNAEENPITNRNVFAIRHLRAVFMSEMRVNIAELPASSRQDATYVVADQAQHDLLPSHPDLSGSDSLMPVTYKLPLHRLFLHDLDLPDNITPIDYTVEISDKLAKTYQIEHSTHREVILQSLQNTVGCFILRGPPATGKTTIVAKIASIARTHFGLQGCIVVTAHTNEAVRVALKRLISLAPLFGIKSESEVCLVLTEAKSEFYQTSGIELDPAIQQYSINVHLDRMAAKNPGRWQAYTQGRRVILGKGRIEDLRLLGEFRNQINIMIQELKKDIKFWFATCATFHHKDRVFGRFDGVEPIDVGLLIVDEASMATDVVIFQVVLCLNPSRIILAGDHLQLSPFLHTWSAKAIWGVSLFEKIGRRESCPRGMLDMQYRTEPSIYKGTNVFYNNDVRSHGSTRERIFQRYLKFTLKKIHFVDTTGKKYPLESNIYFFDILNNTAETNVGPSKSSQSIPERDFILGFIATLGCAGIYVEHIMPLVGYSGQVDAFADGALKLKLKQQGLRAKTIDSSQGDEAQIIMFSMVRTTQIGVGFMADKQRMNVGTSRAREAFFWVGDFNVIEQISNRHPEWRDFYRAAQDQNSVQLRMSFRQPVKWYYENKLVSVDTPIGKPPDFLQRLAPSQSAQPQGENMGSNTGTPRMRSSISSIPGSPAMRTTRLVSPQHQSPVSSLPVSPAMRVANLTSPQHRSPAGSISSPQVAGIPLNRPRPQNRSSVSIGSIDSQMASNVRPGPGPGHQRQTSGGIPISALSLHGGTPAQAQSPPGSRMPVQDPRQVAQQLANEARRLGRLATADMDQWSPAYEGNVERLRNETLAKLVEGQPDAEIMRFRQEAVDQGGLSATVAERVINFCYAQNHLYVFCNANNIPVPAPSSE